MKNKTKWILIVFVLSFILSVIFSAVSTSMANSFNTVMLVFITLAVIAIGILFDMIGVAVLTCKESNLHAKAAKKMKGAKQAIALIKNSTKVSSVCNDVIGDICGIVSGSLGAALTLEIIGIINISSVVITAIVTAIISSLTVGFKAVFKDVAEKNSDAIVYTAGKVISIFKKQ